MDDIDWDAGHVAFARLLARGGPFAAFAHAQSDLWREIARALPEGGHGLIVGHGGFIEAGAVEAFPSADHAAWGRTARHCEGVILRFEQDAFTSVEILRVPRKLRKAE